MVERFVEKRDLSQPKTTYGRRWFKLNAVGVAKCNTETCKGHLNYIKILVDLILLKVFPETIIQIWEVRNMCFTCMAFKYCKCPCVSVHVCVIRVCVYPFTFLYSYTIGNSKVCFWANGWCIKTELTHVTFVASMSFEICFHLYTRAHWKTDLPHNHTESDARASVNGDKLEKFN